jgi:hypothetical protein
MVDLLYVVVVTAFFALMVAFVHLCERIIGRDESLTVVGNGSGLPEPRQDNEPDTPLDFPITTKEASS